MYIAKIVGTVVATNKDECLTGKKILVVQPLNAKLEPEGKCEVAIDSVGAGAGEIVLVATGSPAARVFGDSNSPIDRSIVAIVDTVEANL